ncbi:MAG: TetR/AcrR family transcriptional regulator [Thermomicrobiales bacterium]
MKEKATRNTTRQREAGAASREETRRRLLIAAAEEFEAVGYVSATVNRIATRAGVSVQTLYLAWGSKRELLRAYLEGTLTPSGAPPEEHFASQLIPADPADVIGQIVRLFREVAGRSATAWALYRDAAAVDPAIAEDWQQLQMLRHGTFEILVDRIPDTALRLARPDAVDTAWAIASPDTYDLLVRRAGYSLDRFEEWTVTTLRAALLAE